MEMTDYKLIDNEGDQQYEFHVDGEVPKIEYIRSRSGEVILTHTEVPVVLEGQGIGTRLVESVLTDIEEKGMRVVPMCPFVSLYIRRHPEWKRILVNK